MTVIGTFFRLFRSVREETGSSIYEIKEFFRLGGEKNGKCLFTLYRVTAKWTPDNLHALCFVLCFLRGSLVYFDVLRGNKTWGISVWDSPWNPDESVDD